MYNLASEEFIEQINQPSRKFHCILDFYDFQITDGFELTYYGGADSNNQLSIGSTVSAYVELRIEKTTNILENKEFEVKIGLEIEKDGEVTVEYVPLGVFRTPKTIDDDYSVYFTAYDRMVDFSTPFNSEEVFNHDITMQTLMEWICGDTNGIPYVELPAHIATLTLGDVYYAPWLLGKTLKEVFSGHTKREIIGWIACMCAGYAYVDKIGVLHIISWSTDVERIALDYDVISSFDKGKSDYTVTKVIGKKSYLNADAYSELHTSDKEYSAGDGITGISFQMPFTNQNVVDLIYEQISYFTYRGADVTFMGNPLLEQNDVLEVTDMSGKVYIIPCMQIVHNFDGGLSTTVIATASEQDDIVHSDPNNSQSLYQQVTQIAMALPKKASFEQLEVEIARIDYLEANSLTIEEADIKYAQIEEIEAIQADIKQAVIEDLSAEFITVDALEATNARVSTLETTSLTADSAIIQSLTTEVAKIGTLEADNVDIKDRLTATEANIGILETEKLSAKDIEGKYANIDFSNIGKAAMEYFYSQSGLIENVIVGDATITGNLAGVTIKGDLIEGNTIVAEKLVIKGEDGLYYKLNTDGVKTETEQTNYNSLNGSIITAKSITATKIKVKDLVAFDATIGGFNITENSLYSGVKESVDNTTRGIYLDNDGQIAFGDASNYIKYYKDTDGKYKLGISAESITFSATGKNIEDTIDTAVKDSVGNIEIGGRNYFQAKIKNGDVNIYTKSISSITVNNGLFTIVSGGADLYFGEVSTTTGAKYSGINGILMPVISGEDYTLTIYDENNSSKMNAFFVTWWDDNLLQVGHNSKYGVSTMTHTAPDNATYASVRIGKYDSVAGETYKFRVKFEKGNKATDWTPAPEDVDENITSVRTIANQTAEKFEWIVKSGTSSTDFTLTERMASLTAEIISLNGNVKVNGEMLVDGAVTADKISVTDLSAINATIGGWTIHNDYISKVKEVEDFYGYYYGTVSLDESGIRFNYTEEYGNEIGSGGLGWSAYTNRGLYATGLSLTSTDSMLITAGASAYVRAGNIFLMPEDAKTGTPTDYYAKFSSEGIEFKPNGNAYKPYYSAGDSVSSNAYTAGYVSSYATNIYFEIPLAKPVIGNPTVTVSSISGLIIRQNGKYTHDSTVSTGAVPTSISATLIRGGNAVRVVATMNSSTNATNNDACGIHYNLQILFS